MTDTTIEIPIGQRADGTVETTEVEEVVDPPEGDTFPREYVERLRAEAAEHRTKAKEALEAVEPLQHRLFGLVVGATGRLADPTDLPFDAALLDDEAGLEQAITALLATKPHLASRRVVGDVGQGAGTPADTFSLAGILGSHA